MKRAKVRVEKKGTYGVEQKISYRKNGKLERGICVQWGMFGIIKKKKKIQPKKKGKKSSISVQKGGGGFVDCEGKEEESRVYVQ
jgi:hypothetical protein